jgi:Skp family chaperone for outer membrane proteins
MRNLFSTVLAVAGLMVVAAPVAAQATAKIGYLDSRRIIQEAPGAREAQATLEREFQGFQARCRRCRIRCNR